MEIKLNREPNAILTFEVTTTLSQVTPLTTKRCTITTLSTYRWKLCKLQLDADPSLKHMNATLPSNKSLSRQLNFMIPLEI